jgi:hypothetical protein
MQSQPLLAVAADVLAAAPAALAALCRAVHNASILGKDKDKSEQLSTPG